MSKLEGNAASRMIQIIKKHGYNRDIEIGTATVTSTPPSMKLRLDAVNLELDSQDFIATQTAIDRLQVGDKAVVISTADGQFYYVLDKAVM